MKQDYTLITPNRFPYDLRSAENMVITMLKYIDSIYTPLNPSYKQNAFSYAMDQLITTYSSYDYEYLFVDDVYFQLVSKTLKHAHPYAYDDDVYSTSFFDKERIVIRKILRGYNLIPSFNDYIERLALRYCQDELRIKFTIDDIYKSRFECSDTLDYKLLISELLRYTNAKFYHDFY